MVGEFPAEVVGEVEVAVGEQLVGDVDEGVDPSGADTAGVAGGAGGAGGEQVGHFEDFHGTVGGQVCLQRGHGVGEGLEGEFAAGGGDLVAFLGAVGVDGDDGVAGDVAEFAGGEVTGGGQHQVLHGFGVFGGEGFAVVGDDPGFHLVEHALLEGVQGGGEDPGHFLGVPDPVPGGLGGDPQCGGDLRGGE